MNSDNWASVARSGFKIVGTMLTTVGVLDAAQVGALGPLFDTIVAGVGAAITFVGLFQSYWYHTPDEVSK